MQRKIYVVGMFDADACAKVDAAVKAVPGVTGSTSYADKSYVLVDSDDSVDESAINAAITSTGVEVIG